MKKKISITIEDSLLKEIVKIVDNLYIRNRSQAIEHLVSSSLGEEKTAVILAGGSEENLMVNGDYMICAKVKGATILEHAVKKLRENGFKNLFIIARNKLLTKSFEILRDGTAYGVKITYIEEKISKGTGTTLRLAKGSHHLQNHQKK